MLNLDSFTKNLEKLLPNFKEKQFLLAVSGGADSMVLAFLMQVLGAHFQVAHVNYKLRGEASDLDREVVGDFCRTNNIPLHVYEVSAKDEKPEKSIQLWARDLRYCFFSEIILEENLFGLMTAHHLNDDLESFLINLSRGSGLKGLSGIPKNENSIYRPLLKFTKNEIYEFAKLNNIVFREDASNQKNDYLRNKLRNTIVPELEKIEPKFVQNFSKSVQYLSDAQDFVSQQLEVIFSENVLEKDGCKVINKKWLKAQSDFVKFNLLHRFGFSSPQEMDKIFTAQVGAVFYTQDFQLTIDRELLLISETTNEILVDSSEIILIRTFQELQHLGFQISLEKYIDPIFILERQNLFSDYWSLDASKITFPLRLRKMKSDDVFFPKGMKGKKKVSKFFKDEKISILAKSKIWLLSDASDCVLGVLPLRQDARFLANCKNAKELKLFLG
ncbi:MULTISPECIES: tRNA lysidine(34) synthetase TilS [Amniculibacterium]|uniref:tRNA lysidine(34) synthetase TilS n=1 Tax=Amniculibacterium TaxID=2715289 RepID=UPI000F599178|nr:MULTISPECIES: tRNA lysidine(34) synthetase TilS [Amniculibacterium]